MLRGLAKGGDLDPNPSLQFQGRTFGLTTMQVLAFLLSAGALGSWVSLAVDALKRADDAHRHWRPSEAKILNARIDELRFPAAGDRAGRFRPRVHYVFQVAGIRHESRRILLHGRGDFFDRDAADRWLLSHAPGRTVTVWYDPRCPDDCALILNQPSAWPAAWVAGGALLMAAGAGVLLL